MEHPPRAKTDYEGGIASAHKLLHKARESEVMSEEAMRLLLDAAETAVNLIEALHEDLHRLAESNDMEWPPPRN